MLRRLNMNGKAMNKRAAQPEAVRMALWAAGLLIMVLLVYLLLNGGGQKGNTEMAAAADFQLLAEIDLAARPYGLDTVAKFTLQETADVGIYYAMPNFNTAYLDLSLLGPNGERTVILHSENLKTDAAGGGLWEQRLNPGAYRLLLTTEQSLGVFSVYWVHR